MTDMAARVVAVVLSCVYGYSQICIWVSTNIKWQPQHMH